MNLYKKLACLCSHAEDRHRCGPTNICLDCTCFGYDPAGHNPELENVICPQCKLTHLEKLGTQYICVLCHLVLSQAKVWEIVG